MANENIGSKSTPIDDYSINIVELVVLYSKLGVGGYSRRRC